jgi:RHS repeat-associated protein
MPSHVNRPLRVFLILSHVLLAQWLAEAKYIGAQAPTKCPTCGRGPATVVSSNGGDTISYSEGNLTSMVPVSTGRPTLPLAFTYNSYDADGSRAQIDTVMGYGWTHTYNTFLFDQLGSMFRYDADGRVTKYALGPGGTFSPTNGYFETLVRVGVNFVLTTKDKTVYTFSTISGTAFLVGGPAYRLVSIVDRNGNTTTFTYSSGNLTTVTDTYGRTLTFTYNGLHKLISVTDPNGRVTTIQYDSTGHKISQITDPVGRTVQYSYNSLNQLATKTDKSGLVYTYSYSSSLPVAVRDSNTTSLATLSNPGNWAVDNTTLAATLFRAYIPATTANNDGRTNNWQYQYDSNGYVTQFTTPDSVTYSYTYDPATLNVATATDGNGHTTSYQYDAQGNLIRLTDAMGHVTTYTYEPVFNMMTSMTDPRGRVTTYGYDVHGNRISETDPLGQTRSWTYDSHGNVLTETDKNSHTTTYQYDGFGNRIRITDALGNVTTMTYDAAANMLTRTDANSHTTTWQYDGMDRVTKVTDATGHFTTTAYDGDGNRISVTDRNGHTTTYQYDQRSRLIQTTDALSHSDTNTYDGNDNRISTTDRNSHTTTYQYDARNRLTRTTDALGNFSTATYDGVGNRLTATDANGHTTSYQYDQINRLTNTTDALSHVTQNLYDTGTKPSCAASTPPCGVTPGSLLVTEMIDANGKATYYKYDAIDRLTDIVAKVGSTADTITPADAVTSSTYDAVGNMLTMTEPNSNVTTYQYDALNRKTKQTNAGGDQTTTTYDPVGNTATVTVPNGNVYTYTYDALDREIQLADSVGLYSTATYDFEANRLTMGDGNGNVIHDNYDAINRVTSEVDALSQTATTVYDAVGNVTSVTDRNSHTTTYTYDLINRRITMTDPLSHTTQYQYDQVGNLIRVTDANSRITTYQYDALNRPQQVTGADGLFRSFAYDNTTHVSTRTDELGRVTNYGYNDLYFLLSRTYPSAVNDSYTYDLSGRMLSAQRGGWPEIFTYDGADRTLTSVQNGHTVSYSYNIPGRTRTLNYPGGRSIIETTDARARLDHINGGGPNIVQYTYDLGNRALTRAYPNGVTATYTYNVNNWITSLQHNGGSLIAGFGYQYDNEGNKAFENKNHDTAHSEAYQYDNADRVISYKVGTLIGSTVPAPVTQTAYNLDPVGNWNSKTTDAVTQTRTHNATNELTQIDATPLTYEATGNLLNDGTYTYAYDEENRVISTTRNSDSAIVGQYLYDAFGRRVQKIANPAGSPTTTRYFYDDYRIIEEQDGGGATQATYVYGSYVDEPLTMDRGGSTYYYHQNALWSVEAITDSAGNPVERYAYDAYGVPSVTTGAGVPVPPNAWGTAHSAIGNPWLYTGRELDEEGGLYYYRARYYDAAKGRFLERDALGDPDHPNLYEYVDSNPINLVDPAGYAPCCKVKSISLVTDFRIFGFRLPALLPFLPGTLNRQTGSDSPTANMPQNPRSPGNFAAMPGRINPNGVRLYEAQHTVWVVFRGENLSDCDFSRRVSSTETRTDVGTGREVKTLVGFGGFMGAKVADPAPVTFLIRTDPLVIVTHTAGLRNLRASQTPASFQGSYDLRAISKSDGQLKGQISYDILVDVPRLGPGRATTSATPGRVIIPPVPGFRFGPLP